MNEIYYMSATETLQKIQSKNLSCVEVMQAYLDRIDKINPIINSLQQVLPAENALKQAKLADQAIAQGLPLGKLHGLPVTIKDAFFVNDFVTSCGSLGFRDFFKNQKMQEATVVSRLRNAGAIIIGMTNVPEMLICPESDNLVYGQTKNPYNFSRTCGGSSGGEGATLAAGCSSLGIGSDGGGSIRVPSHFSGVAGLKPSQYRVPNTGGGFGLDLGLLSHFVVTGPMARAVDDLLLCLSIIAGPDGYDPHTMPVPLHSSSPASLKNLRVAFYTDDGNRTPTQDIQDTVKNAAFALKDFVGIVDENRPECLSKTWPLVWEAAFLGGDGAKGHKETQQLFGNPQISSLYQQFLHLAEACNLSVTEMNSRIRAMDQFRVELLGFFQKYDIILCPVVATCAKPHGMALKEIMDLTYCMSYNLGGNPSVVVRCGTSKEGLPIGVQVIAKPWLDDVALLVAKQLEGILGGWKPSPHLT